MRGRWVLLLSVAATWPGQQALGWGSHGPRVGGTGITIEKLPDDVPTFVRDPATLPELALMSHELDRARGG